MYRAYARAVGASLDECGAPLDSFESFNEFFARPLVSGARPQSDAPFTLPSDGRVDACGTIRQGRAVQAKGIDYSVGELLGDETFAHALEGGDFATVYLSPADYHRVHAPCAMAVSSVRHIPGELWPVNGLSVPFVEGLFRRNERVVFLGETPEGLPAALVMVGATVVGKIRVSHSDATTLHDRTHRFAPAWEVERGAELGAFLLGSTAIVLVGADSRGERLWRVQSGDPAVLGRPLWDAPA